MSCLADLKQTFNSLEMAISMNKIRFWGVFGFVAFLMSFSLLAQQTQNEKQFDLVFKVMPEMAEKGNCVVEVVKNGKETLKIDIPVSEKYVLHLDYFNQYKLQFKYPGYISKTISVSTEIPKEIWQKNPNFPPFPMLVTLVKKTAENASEGLSKPSLGIAYNKEIDNFTKVVLENK